MTTRNYYYLSFRFSADDGGLSAFRALLSMGDAAAAFAQANRSRSGGVTPGELLCHLCVECGQPRDGLAELFLLMDLNGDGTLDGQEWKAGYKKYAAQSGLRPKNREGESLSPYTASEMYARAWRRASNRRRGLDARSCASQRSRSHPPGGLRGVHRKSFETEAEALLQPKLEGLRQAFDMLDMDKDGRVSTRELQAFQIVLGQQKQAELQAAAEQAIAEPPPAGTPPPSTILDVKTKAMLSLDLERNLAELTAGPPGGLRDDHGNLYLDFNLFKSLLARHAGALQGGAKDAGGKKGKGKKKK
jgi:hypothetical protein